MQNNPVSVEPRHPVMVVSERTGLSPHVLRIWERRYQAVTPSRSEGGQRLYSDADIARLSLLHQASAGGRNVSHLVTLPDEALLELIAARGPAPAAAGGSSQDLGVVVSGKSVFIFRLSESLVNSLLKKSYWVVNR